MSSLAAGVVKAALLDLAMDRAEDWILDLDHLTDADLDRLREKAVRAVQDQRWIPGVIRRLAEKRIRRMDRDDLVKLANKIRAAAAKAAIRYVQ